MGREISDMRQDISGLKQDVLALNAKMESHQKENRENFLAVRKELLSMLKLADKGWKRAMSEDRHLLNGLNVWNGKVTCEPVATALGLPYTPAAVALA